MRAMTTRGVSIFSASVLAALTLGADYGELNEAAPSETKQFAFIVGKWDCKTRFMNQQGTYGEGRAT